MGGATLGVGLLVGGIIFNVTGAKLSDKADAAYSQAKKIDAQVNKVTWYLRQLKDAANGYQTTLSKVEEQYRKRLKTLDFIISFSEKTNWSDFSEKEQKMTENLILLVGLLYKMCQVKLVLQAEKEDELNTVNKEEMDETVRNAENILANELDDNVA